MQTYPDSGELDIEAYDPADVDDIYGRVAGYFAPAEPDELFWDLAINRAADGGRVVNFASA